MGNIEFTEYDRITDILMYLSDTMTLNFTVGLSRKGKTGDRIFFQYETRYGSDKYGSDLRSIKRQMNFCFTIDCKDDFLAGMMFRPQDVELLVRLIEARVLPWFLGGPNETAYKVIDDKIIVTEYEPVSYVQESKYITFEPCVATDRNEMETRGIRITLSSGYSCIVPVDQFMGFLHILSTTDMYGTACAMCNYVKQQPYGVNIYSTTGLGASPKGNNKIDDAWRQSFNKNAFLDKK